MAATAITAATRPSMRPVARERSNFLLPAVSLVTIALDAHQVNSGWTLIKALVRAHRWRRRIESGQAKSITDLAEQEGVTDAYVCRLLPLTCLAPDIVEAILEGRQPKDLRLTEMLGNGPLGWEEQRVNCCSGST
jgi:hypothetical protein